MANEEHVKILKKSVEEFNKWRTNSDDPWGRPDHNELRDVDLEGADLAGLDLKGIQLSKAKLKDVQFGDTLLEKADFVDADLRDTYFCYANLKNAKLYSANLNGANLDEAKMEGAIFAYAKLENAILIESTLKGAVFKNADLNGARFDLADLENADLRWVKGLKLDNSFIRNARFEARAKDPWSVLRRTYSGPRLAFNLIFLVVFLTPYIAKVLFWTTATQWQTVSGELTKRVYPGFPKL